MVLLQYLQIFRRLAFCHPSLLDAFAEAREQSTNVSQIASAKRLLARLTSNVDSVGTWDLLKFAMKLPEDLKRFSESHTYGPKQCAAFQIHLSNLSPVA